MSKIVRVGIIGTGDVSQIVHIPTLGFLSDHFTITYLCDASAESLKHNSQKVINHTPRTTQDYKEVCASDEVDLVFIASPDEYHLQHVIEALRNDKHVFIEKPMALCLRDADNIVEVEKSSKGSVFVGYMRRYASAFIDAVKEVGGMDKIVYARVRDIIGPNSHFIGQSGTFPRVFSDFTPEVVQDKKDQAAQIVKQALEVECGVPVTDNANKIWRRLGGLGSHDISAMREILGMPTRCIGASLKLPYWSAILEYPTFSVTYESGTDDIPRFDCHIEVYSMSKSVRVNYDTPFVKGLPVTMTIFENVDSVYKETTVRKTYEDPYTLEMKELYQMVVNGKRPKTSAEDAREDLEVFQMIMKAGNPSGSG